MITLRQILEDTIWVVKMQGWRTSGTYRQMKHYADDEECRDFDICASQPEHLREFYEEYFKYDREHGFTTVQDFYMKHYALKKEELPKMWLHRSDGTWKFYGTTGDGKKVLTVVINRKPSGWVKA